MESKQKQKDRLDSNLSKLEQEVGGPVLNGLLVSCCYFFFSSSSSFSCCCCCYCVCTGIRASGIAPRSSRAEPGRALFLLRN